MENLILQDMISKWGLEYLTPKIDPKQIEITVPEINRPALQLAGFYEDFDHNRVQIMGNVESSYLAQFDEKEQLRRYEGLFNAGEGGIPAIIYCRGCHPTDRVCHLAEEHGTPILVTDRATGDFSADLIVWLKDQFAPVIRVHGVLVEVYGIGVMITGESGIGKSEAALELVKRGHRLVSDDAVNIKRTRDDRLEGSAPDIIKNLIELRGIGIIDVKMLYGIGSICDSCGIDMVIHLEEWDRTRSYERFGAEVKHIEYLGVSVQRYDMPIRPGRNLAIIVETAAMNHRMKGMGYNAGESLIGRVNQNLAQPSDEEKSANGEKE